MIRDHAILYLIKGMNLTAEVSRFQAIKKREVGGSSVVDCRRRNFSVCYSVRLLEFKEGGIIKLALFALFPLVRFLGTPFENMLVREGV